MAQTATEQSKQKDDLLQKNNAMQTQFENAKQMKAHAERRAREIETEKGERRKDLASVINTIKERE